MGLESNLLVSRSEVAAYPYAGKAHFEPTGTTISSLTTPLRRGPDHPLVTLDTPPDLQITALVSGTRSVIFERDGRIFLAKGSNVVPDREYIVNDKDGHPTIVSPWGTQTYSRALHEIQITGKVLDSFLKDGRPYPRIPAGIWVYEDVLFKDEPCAASVFEIGSNKRLNDTRLDELMHHYQVGLGLPYDYLNKSDRQYVESVLGRVARLTGQVVRFLHSQKFNWNSARALASNAHIANIVVFEHNGLVAAAPIDFDSARVFEKGSILSHAGNFVIDKWRDVISAFKVVSYQAEYELGDFISSFETPDVLLTENPLAYNPEDVHITLIDEMLKERTTLNEQKRMDAQDGILRYLSGVSSPAGGILRKKLTNIFLESYKVNPKKGVREELPWSELVGLEARIVEMREGFLDDAWKGFKSTYSRHK